VLTPAGLAGQAYVESHFRPDAVSSSGAQGLMQLTAANFARYGVDANGDGRADPFTPADSIATGAQFNCSLASGLKNVKGSRTELRLAAYNAGINAVRKYQTIPPYPETQNYVQQVQAWTTQFADAFPPANAGSGS
jgi:soluble lytic murein transglycosylase-like protein